MIIDLVEMEIERLYSKQKDFAKGTQEEQVCIFLIESIIFDLKQGKEVFYIEQNMTNQNVLLNLFMLIPKTTFDFEAISQRTELSIELLEKCYAKLYSYAERKLKPLFYN